MNKQGQLGRKWVAAGIVVLAVISGCAEGEPGTEAVSFAQVIGEATLNSTGAMTKLSAPLTAALQGGDAGVAGTARDRIEAAIRTLATSAGCLSLDWAMTTVTVRFDHCRIPETDELLDGSLSLRVRVVDPAVVVTTDRLAIGDEVFHGTVTAYPKPPLSALTLGVDADLTREDPLATVRVSGLTVAATAEGVTVAGSGNVITDRLDADITMNQLHWELGDCLPSSGSLSFVDGSLSGVITFLPTTPATGEVRLRIAPFPASTTKLFPACR